MAELAFAATGFAKAINVSFRNRIVPSLLILRTIRFQPVLKDPIFVLATVEPARPVVPEVLAGRVGVTKIVSLKKVLATSEL